MNEAGRVSFGFNRPTYKSKLLPPSELSDGTETKETSIDYVTSFDSCIPQCESVLPDKNLVIPLRVSCSNIFEQPKKKSNNLTAEALKSASSEILSSMGIAPSNKVSIVAGPLEKDVLTIEDVVDPDYNQVPVEHFGLALLKGMGLKEDDVKQRTSERFAAKLRLKGLGLGADRKVLLKSRKMMGEDSEKLVWKVGAKCQIVYGRNDGQYGVIQGVDGDIGRVVIQLTATKQIVKVMQAAVRLVSYAEFEKFGHYLDMAGAKQCKAEMANEDSIQCCMNREGGQGEGTVKACRTKRRMEDIAKYGHRSTWLQRGLIVRYLDKESKYYLQKIKIMSVSGSQSHPYRCSCETEGGRVLRHIHESKLQPTVPKRLGESVVVIRGQYLGESGRLIERNDHSLQARISLHTTKKEVFLHYDDICCFWSLY
ncbi:G patch domain and KOW motifs containing [Echinococcus multilocularis]|uniref:G patch domain and KOW motifs containing n=1 Tax=Echinococcus multilocularis TaxID=6211 RepID=A0A068YEA2_ECHMU|nr:G patch domain and KOW motifs containing [Echinococcus multilocularis]